jgi:predicted 3-demethylubiquinone-9 3-methyltransferase (glyoxalase superfamily)
MSKKISPFLWFDHEAEEAASYYVKLFKNAKLGTVTRYTAGTPLPEGTVMTVTFTIEDQEFTALNGGPEYKFTPAVSFVVACDSQAEIDHYWDTMIADGGQSQRCGWIKDKFGLSWQIVPRNIGELFSGDREKAARTTAALMKMDKLDVEKLRNA